MEIFLFYFIYFLYFFGCVGSQLHHVGSSVAVVARGLLSSCGAQAPEHSGLCSLWHVGSLVEARKLSSCGARASLPRGLWDLSSPTRDRTRVPCIGRRILYHCTAREVPVEIF